MGLVRRILDEVWLDDGADLDGMVVENDPILKHRNNCRRAQLGRATPCVNGDLAVQIRTTEVAIYALPPSPDGIAMYHVA